MSFTSPDHLVVTGVSWSRGQPDVRVRRLSEARSELVPLVGFSLNYRTSPESPRHCLGHTPFRQRGVDHVDCLNHPEPGSRKCSACAVVDATFASNLHHAHTRGRAELDPSIVEHLQQPNLLYLAGFRDGSVKVGTSSEPRRDTRLAEQGAWRAHLVARAADGFAVRVLEDRVTADLQVSQAVAIGRKLAGMTRPRPDAELETELARLSGEVRSLLETMDDDRFEPLDDGWLFDGADRPVWSGLHPYPLRLDSGVHDIEVRAACGRVAAVSRPGSDDLFAVDVGQLFGVSLEVGDFTPDELAVQDALF